MRSLPVAFSLVRRAAGAGPGGAHSRRAGAGAAGELPRHHVHRRLLPAPDAARRHDGLEHPAGAGQARPRGGRPRSEEHTSELQSLMRISYADFCLKKKNTHKTTMITKYN